MRRMLKFLKRHRRLLAVLVVLVVAVLIVLGFTNAIEYLRTSIGAVEVGRFATEALEGETRK